MSNKHLSDIEARLASVVRNIKVRVLKIDCATQSDLLELCNQMNLALSLRAQCDGAWGVLDGDIGSGEE